jgi:hypothetical protein
MGPAIYQFRPLANPGCLSDISAPKNGQTTLTFENPQSEKTNHHQRDSKLIPGRLGLPVCNECLDSL